MRRSATVESLCAVVTSGGTPRRDDSANYAPATVPWIKTAELNDGEITSYEECISEQGLDNSSAKLLPAGTVLMAMYGATVGMLGRLSFEATCNQASCAMVADPSQCDSRWLFYALMNRRQEIVGLANGAAQQNLNAASIKSFELDVPPLPEQQAIAEVLGALDDKIAANKTLLDCVSKLSTARFEELVRGTDDNSLEAIAEINAASVQPSDGHLRYLDISAVDVGSYAEPIEMPWAEAPGRARRAVRFGDTIWATVRPNRRAHALVLEGTSGLVASTGLATLSPTNVGFAYLYEATQTPAFVEYLVSNAKGSAYPAVNGRAFNLAPVPLVSQERERRFSAEVEPLWLRAATAQRESRTLASLRDTLLPALMSGKLRVRDAIATAEKVL